MDNGSEKRRHVRYKVPLSTILPEISDEPFVLEDVSTGGFKVVLPKKPESDTPIKGALYRSGTLIGRFFARVAWERASTTTPPSWTIGVSMDVHGGDKSRLKDEMQAAINMVS